MKFLFLSLLLLPCLNSCGFKNAVLFPPPQQIKQPIEDVYVVLILIDGGRPQEMDELVSKGYLPTFKDLFYDQGVRFQNAISVVPTVSTPAHQAFISGLLPGHHGVPNLDWFSRPLAKHIDYLKVGDISLTSTYMFNFEQVKNDSVVTDQPQLIYHALKGYPTMSVFETATSGVTLRLPAHPPFLTAYHGKIEKFYEKIDLEAIKLTLEQFRKLPHDQLPRFSYISFYGMDLVMHFDSPRGNRVKDLYLQYDRFLKELRDLLQKRGIWDKTTLIVVSDHGQHELKKVTSLPKIFSRLGLKFNRSPSSQIVWGDHGTAFSNLYFKIGNDWKNRPSYHDLQNYPVKENKHINLIEKFLEEPDIEFVVAPEGPNRTHLHRKNQHAIIERRIEAGKTLFRYQPDPGQDPLGYLNDPVITDWVQHQKYEDAETWLKHSHDKEIPDGVVLLSQLFDDYRNGDMVLSTVKESQFKEKRLSGHGSFYAEDLRILMMLHGRQLRPGVYPYMRSIDLYPTLLKLYGLKGFSPTDGIARNEILHSAPSTLADKTDTYSAKTVQQFQIQLSEKLKDPSLSKVEREKAIQLMYSIEQYEAEHQEDAQATESISRKDR